MNKTIIAIFTSLLSALFDSARRDRVWRSRGWLFALGGLMTGAAAVLLALVSFPATADYELPPRDEPPNSSPDVTITGSIGEQSGVRIHLEGIFATSWPWETLHWQEDLWHELEWYSEQTGWTGVDGWSGRFDTIYQQDERMIGRRELWGDGALAGTGPFRWRVYRSSDSALLATSDVFYMPQQPGNILTVRQELLP